MPGDTTLILVDLGAGRMRMGGSMLAQVLGQFGNEVPDLDEPAQLKALVDAINRLRDAGLVLAYHDRSDGGLWATLCEMAFAGHLGVSLNVDLLVTEGDGIGDSRAEYGDSKNWATQVSARREELTLRALFNEELGVVIQVPTARRDEAMQVLRAAGLEPAQPRRSARPRRAAWSRSGAMPRRSSPRRCATCIRRGTRSAGASPACATTRPAPTPSTTPPAATTTRACTCTSSAPRPRRAPALVGARPKVAVLREQGVNSHVELSYAMDQAGFDTYDVHMTDLQSGRARLDKFQGFVACGGFSYGDTLGAGEGWARSILFNPQLADQFATFFAPPRRVRARRLQRLPDAGRARRDDPGRRRLAALHAQPQRAVRGAAQPGRGAAVAVDLLRRPGGQPAADRGRARRRLRRLLAARRRRARCTRRCASSITTASATEAYPANPNGSPGGLTAVTTADGRYTALMPHPERVFRNVQMSWTSGERSAPSPWMRMFENARRVLG